MKRVHTDRGSVKEKDKIKIFESESESVIEIRSSNLIFFTRESESEIAQGWMGGSSSFTK